MRGWWLKVKQLVRDAQAVQRTTGSHAIVRVEKRAASKDDIAAAAKRIMKDHEQALRWLADK